MKWLSDAFWDERVWLPPGTAWPDVTPGPGKPVTYTNQWHVLLTIPMAVVLMAMRLMLDKYAFAPFGKSLGIKHNKNKKAFPNQKLEAAYKANLDWKKETWELSQQIDISERQMQRWWRRRRLQDKPTTLVKFCESAWRGTFFLYNFMFGLFVLWDKKWFWELDHCYIGYPHQGITNDIWWYYMGSFAFYWSLTFSLCSDVRRKDFSYMVTHHLAALTLLYLSWVCNTHRIGSLVLLLHDCSELLLEITKAVRYANYEKTSICTFVIFSLSWMVTRLMIFPYIIWSTLAAPIYLMATVPSIRFRGPLYGKEFPMGFLILYLLCLLLALNIYWTWIILKMNYKVVMYGEMKGDIRSSSSEASDIDGALSDRSLTSRDGYKKTE